MVVPRRMPRRLLIASLLVGSGMGLFAATAFGVTAIRGGRTSDQRAVKDGGTVKVGVRTLDVIEPAKTISANGGTTIGLVSRSLVDATCAMLFRYPVARPPILSYDLRPEVATGYPVRSHDGKT